VRLAVASLLPLYRSVMQVIDGGRGCFGWTVYWLVQEVLSYPDIAGNVNKLLGNNGLIINLVWALIAELLHGEVLHIMALNADITSFLSGLLKPIHNIIYHDLIGKIILAVMCIRPAQRAIEELKVVKRKVM